MNTTKKELKPPYTLDLRIKTTTVHQNTTNKSNNDRNLKPARDSTPRKNQDHYRDKAETQNHHRDWKWPKRASTPWKRGSKRPQRQNLRLNTTTTSRSQLMTVSKSHHRDWKWSKRGSKQQQRQNPRLKTTIETLNQHEEPEHHKETRPRLINQRLQSTTKTKNDQRETQNNHKDKTDTQNHPKYKSQDLKPPSRNAKPTWGA